MQRSIKRDKIIEFVKNGVNQYLSENLEKYGFSHVIDVNMSEDLKTAYIYFSCPLEKTEKKLENSIMKDKRAISKIFSKTFSSKYMPRTEFVCVRELDVEF